MSEQHPQDRPASLSKVSDDRVLLADPVRKEMIMIDMVRITYTIRGNTVSRLVTRHLAELVRKTILDRYPTATVEVEKEVR